MANYRNIGSRQNSLSDREARVRRFRPDALGALSLLISVVVAMVVLCAANAATQVSIRASKESGEAGDERAANGKRLFVKYGCYECHGFEGQGGGSAGPRIGPNPIPLSALIGYLRAPAGIMPPYTDKVVSDKELADIHDFLESLPHPQAAKK